MIKIIYTILFLIVFSFSIGQKVNFTSSNLPIVIIETGGVTIPDEPKINVNLKIIYNGPGMRNNVTDQVYDYNGFAGMELRGNSSQSFDQKQYAVETRDAAGDNLSVPLLGMPKENDWVLYAPWNDISMIRNVIAYHLWDNMDHWGPRTRLCEVMLNGEYQGVYVLTESIKRDDNRIKTAKLGEADITGREVTGGYIMKIDASNNDNDKTFASKVQGLGTNGGGTVNWLYHYPKSKNIAPEQEDYIHKYIDTVETLIQSSNFADPINGYAKYLSLPSFIDYFIHSELSLNSDGMKRSAYFYKEKNGLDGTKGKFKAGSVWDYNLAYGNCNFCKGNQINAWVHEGCETLPTPAMWKRLIEDPNFINAVKCRYNELRTSILSDSYIHSFIDSYADTLNEAQARHFTQWDALLDNGSGGGGGWFSPLWFSAYRVKSYTEEIDTLKGWFSERLRFLDNNLGGQCLITNTSVTIDSFDDVFVFPNPTQGAISVEVSQPIERIEIYSLQGQKVDELIIKGGGRRVVISMFENYPSGIYTLLLYGHNEVVTRTVLKQE